MPDIDPLSLVSITDEDEKAEEKVFFEIPSDDFRIFCSAP